MIMNHEEKVELLSVLLSLLTSFSALASVVLNILKKMYCCLHTLPYNNLTKNGTPNTMNNSVQLKSSEKVCMILKTKK